MKRRMVEKASSILLVLAVMCVTFAGHAYAQYDDQLLSETEDILNSEQIDIDGSYKKKKTAADRIAEMRKKLEKKNEDMVSKKIEDMRIKEEMRMTKKLQAAFEGNMKELEESPKVAPTPAPVIPQIVVAPKIEKKVEPKKKNLVKVIPSFGVLNMQGKDVDFESKLNMGFSIESMVGSRLSVGIKFNYATMELSEIDSRYNSNSYYGSSYDYGYGYTPYGPGYQSQYGEGREINYKQYSVGVNGKFYMVTDATILPYLGVGVSFNKASLKYEDQDRDQPYYYNNIYYGDEDYSSSYISGTVLLGSDIKFNENIGMMVEFNYTKGTSGFNSKSEARSRYVNPDQVKLEEIGENIEKSNVYAINAGFIFAF